jgi:hypothetical protein
LLVCEKLYSGSANGMYMYKKIKIKGLTDCVEYTSSLSIKT